ncbi:MAG: transaldolase [bacterium]|nr:transaldolase [bacterium]
MLGSAFLAQLDSTGIPAFGLKLFLDGAKLSDMRLAREAGHVSGFTTNPTLMRKDGVTNYEAFAREVIEAIPDMPLSFEVFSDEMGEMEREARTISSWGGEVYVKIPVTNTLGESTVPLIEKLSADGIRINVTALMTLDQVRTSTLALHPDTPGIISVFAGRIADTGIDPVPVMAKARGIVTERPGVELLWASPREILNVYQAEQVGCHIITCTADVIAKLKLAGKNLDAFSLETVEMFRRDALAAGYKI